MCGFIAILIKCVLDIRVHHPNIKESDQFKSENAAFGALLASYYNENSPLTRACHREPTPPSGRGPRLAAGEHSRERGGKHALRLQKRRQREGELAQLKFLNSYLSRSTDTVFQFRKSERNRRN